MSSDCARTSGKIDIASSIAVSLSAFESSTSRLAPNDRTLSNNCQSAWMQRTRALLCRTAGKVPARSVMKSSKVVPFEDVSEIALFTDTIRIEKCRRSCPRLHPSLPNKCCSSELGPAGANCSLGTTVPIINNHPSHSSVRLHSISFVFDSFFFFFFFISVRYMLYRSSTPARRESSSSIYRSQIPAAL